MTRYLVIRIGEETGILDTKEMRVAPFFQITYAESMCHALNEQRRSSRTLCWESFTEWLEVCQQS
jgi:hypothetical protein